MHPGINKGLKLNKLQTEKQAHIEVWDLGRNINVFKYQKRTNINYEIIRNA